MDQVKAAKKGSDHSLIQQGGKTRLLFVRGEQCFHAFAQSFVLGTDSIKERGAFIRWRFQGGFKQGFFIWNGIESTHCLRTFRLMQNPQIDIIMKMKHHFDHENDSDSG